MTDKNLNEEIEFGDVQQEEHGPNCLTETSTYDKFSALLLSSILVVGFVVVVGFSAWLAQFGWEAPHVSIIDDVTTTSYDEVTANELEFNVPMIDEPNESMQDDSRELDMPKQLEALTDAFSRVKADVIGYAGQYIDNGPDLSGFTDKREPGPPDVIPEPKRWRITYQADSSRDYYGQLDALGIELGALSINSGRIDLISDLTQAKPNREFTSRKQEQRLYFMHTERQLKKWDVRACERAGINVNDTICVQFYSDESREILRQVEVDFIKNDSRTLEEVSRVFFGTRKTEGGYEFYVERVEYLPKDERL